MVRLIFILVLFTLKTFSQTSRLDSLAAQVNLPSMNMETKRVSNNWAQTINKGIDTNTFIIKKLINKTYSDGQIKCYKTKEGYSKIIKTFTTKDGLVKIVFYSLGTWPLQIETYVKDENIENLYFDKTNLMAWEKSKNQFVDMNSKDFFPKNKHGLDMFDRALKASKSKDKFVKE